MSTSQLRGLAAALCVGSLAGSAGQSPVTLPRISHYDTREVTTLRFDSVVAQMIAVSYNAAEDEKLERGLCLYGLLERGDSAHGGVAIHVTRGEEPVYQSRHTFPGIMAVISFACNLSADYLGRWHAHIRNVGIESLAVRRFSSLDNAREWLDTMAVVNLIGVGYYTPDSNIVSLWRLPDSRNGTIALASKPRP